MKKIKLRTFKGQILLLCLMMSLPAMGLALTASHMIAKEAQSQIIEEKQNTLSLLTKQYDAGIESVKNYIELLLYQENSYVGLRFNENTTNYQQARIWLWGNLDQIRDYFPEIAGFYVRVKKNDDCFISRKKQISLEIEDYLKTEIIEKKDTEKPLIVSYEDTEYLLYGYENNFMEMGFFINLTELMETFVGNIEEEEVLGLELRNASEVIWLKSGKWEEKREISVDFTSMDMRLLLYYPPFTLTRGLSVLQQTIWYSSIVLLCLFPVFFIMLNRWFIKPMNCISQAMWEILCGNIDYRISEFSNNQEFRRIEQAFNSVLNYSRDLKIKIYEREIEIEKEKLTNLKLQINPHLLLNSLNTICSLAVNQKTSEIQEFAVNLSKYFRYALRNTGELVTLRSELEFIKAYNKIQKIRYPNTFYIVYDIDEEIMDERIPPLIIQNFVENSTKYALMADKEIEILVIVRKEEDMLRISVCDNGRGMELELLEKIECGEPIKDGRGEHIGIMNCKQRLKTIYGEKAQIRISSEKGVGTQVWIEMPSMQQGLSKRKADESKRKVEVTE